MVLAADAREGAEPGRLRNDGVGGDSVVTSRLPEPHQYKAQLEVLQGFLRAARLSGRDRGQIGRESVRFEGLDVQRDQTEL
jgi:hypothetical protein